MLGFGELIQKIWRLLAIEGELKMQNHLLKYHIFASEKEKLSEVKQKLKILKQEWESIEKYLDEQ